MKTKERDVWVYKKALDAKINSFTVYMNNPNGSTDYEKVKLTRELPVQKVEVTAQQIREIMCRDHYDNLDYKLDDALKDLGFDEESEW